MDITALAHFDPVLKKKAFEVDEFYAVDERILELMIQAHFFVSENVAVDA